MTDPVTIVDYRAGYAEAVLSATSEAGDKGDVLAWAMRYRFGWVITTTLSHDLSDPIPLKPAALAALREYAEDELAMRLGKRQ